MLQEVILNIIRGYKYLPSPLKFWSKKAVLCSQNEYFIYPHIYNQHNHIST